ncbi:thioredoxin-like protein [Conidiobolus coronatus NRRL 28638]|uniref:Thioredoxin-like protein n=1 Tax=Conidiobolus coronatus (strain ATCC 28846 / CBS 209.66 / NRRL 28638) TaxID=796925 RepID=A0A137P7B6_CONC2|nr:thioredoxin-like protein [Conidiobolus coronatus NRRL 28638]|eukprot:KXN70900.1 thioredoxin-like protein [Conidiobolus coronatus NRRL 28638]
MKFTNFLSLAALVSLTSADNIELNDKNLSTSIQNGTWFVKYFAEYCKYSKQIAPIWKNVSTELTQWSKNNDFKFASVNCSKYEELCSKNNIEGYPTLYVYKDAKLIEEYNGERDNEDLKAYVKEEAKKLKAI